MEIPIFAAVHTAVCENIRLCADTQKCISSSNDHEKKNLEMWTELLKRVQEE